MTPLVSILVPCFNAAPWLAQTLESALAQDWPRKEIIVVDDGSADASLLVAQAFADRGVMTIGQPRRGAGAARNTALGASRGDWIQYLDADDLLAPDKISRQLRLAAEVGPGMVLCARWARFTDRVDDAAFGPLTLCLDAAPLDWVMLKLGGGDMMHPAAWLVSRKTVDRAGPWDTRLSLDDDGEYFTRVVLASQGVRHCPGAVSYYRSDVKGSLSRRRSSAACESALLSIRLSARHLLAAEDSARTRRVCADMFMRLSQFIYPDAPEIVRSAEMEADRHGGSCVLPPGGRMFKAAARLFGWKAAIRTRMWRRGRDVGPA